jgi:hypothetical protein
MTPNHDAQAVLPFETLLGGNDPRGCQCGAEARARKESVLAFIAARRSDLVRRGEVELLRALLASPTETATIEVIHEPMNLDRSTRKSWIGAVPRRLARLRIIARAGFVEGRREASHGRPLTLWRLVTRAAAEAELRALMAQRAPDPYE